MITPSTSRPTGARLQVLSGTDGEFTLTPCKYEHYIIPFLLRVKMQSAYARDAKALLNLAFDNVRFLSLLSSLAQKDSLWQSLYAYATGANGTLSGTLGSWFGDLFSGAKAWNVERGAEKIKEYENELAALREDNGTGTVKKGYEEEYKKIQDKLETQRERQQNRKENYNDWNTNWNVSDEQLEKNKNKYGVDQFGMSNILKEVNFGREYKIVEEPNFSTINNGVAQNNANVTGMATGTNYGAGANESLLFKQNIGAGLNFNQPITGYNPNQTFSPTLNLNNGKPVSLFDNVLSEEVKKATHTGLPSQTEKNPVTGNSEPKKQSTMANINWGDIAGGILTAGANVGTAYMNNKFENDRAKIQAEAIKQGGMNATLQAQLAEVNRQQAQAQAYLNAGGQLVNATGQALPEGTAKDVLTNTNVPPATQPGTQYNPYNPTINPYNTNPYYNPYAVSAQPTQMGATTKTALIAGGALAVLALGYLAVKGSGQKTLSGTKSKKSSGRNKWKGIEGLMDKPHRRKGLSGAQIKKNRTKFFQPGRFEVTGYKA